MATWCRVNNGRVKETTNLEPGVVIPIQDWQACPDNVKQGMVYDKDKDEYTEYVHQLTEEEKTQIALADEVGRIAKEKAIADGTYKEPLPPV